MHMSFWGQKINLICFVKMTCELFRDEHFLLEVSVQSKDAQSLFSTCATLQHFIHIRHRLMFCVYTHVDIFGILWHTRRAFSHCALLIYIFYLCNFLCKYLGMIVNIYNYYNHLQGFDCGVQSGAGRAESDHQGNSSHLVSLPLTVLLSPGSHPLGSIIFGFCKSTIQPFYVSLL